MNATSGGPLFDRPLAPSRRLFGALAGQLLLLAASPGLFFADGSALLAVLGVAVWAATVVRPLGERRWRARLAEWFAGAVGGGGAMIWIWYVTPGGVAYIGAGWDIIFYCICTGPRSFE